MERCVGNIPARVSAMEGCVGNIPAHQGYGGMCRKYSCTYVCECYGEVCKMFLHRRVINIPAHKSGMKE